MSVYIRPGVMVRIEQFAGPRPPQPLPLESGFSANKLYEILGMHCPSESGEAYLILCNDDEQIWFISNRHVRVICPDKRSPGSIPDSDARANGSVFPGPLASLV